jgi:hypothetical protein
VLLQQLLAAELLVALRLETYLQEWRHLLALDGQTQQVETHHLFYAVQAIKVLAHFLLYWVAYLGWADS